MQYLKKNFIDYVFILLRKHNNLKEILSIFSITGSCADVFCFKSEAIKLFASNFTWVIGGGIYQHINVVSSVNNPSPLTHENIKMEVLTWL
jgi:hypothetical protein